MANVKGLTEQRGEIVFKMQSLLNTAKEQNRALSEEEATNFDKMEKDVQGIEKTIKIEERMQALGAGTVVKGAPENQEERAMQEFAQVVRDQYHGIRADNTNYAKGDAGAILPVQIANKIIEAVDSISPIVQMATKSNVKGTLKVPYYPSDTTNLEVGYSTDFSNITAHSGQFSYRELNTYPAGCLVIASRDLIENVEFNLSAYLISHMGTEFGKWLENESINGTSGKMDGIIRSYDSTNMKTTLAKKSSVAIDDLMSLQDKIVDRYQSGACWIVKPTTRSLLRKLKDGNGRYLLEQDVTQKWGYALFGKPVYVSDNMPALGTLDNAGIIYGDMSGLWMNITRQIEFQVLREVYAIQGAVGILGTMCADCTVIEPQKIAVAVCAASD